MPLHFCSKNNTYKLEKLQKKAIRYVTLDYNCNSYKSLLNKCNKHPMYFKRIHRMMELLFKIQTDASPDYLKDFILLKKTNFNLRNENVLSIPKFKTKCMDKETLDIMNYFTGMKFLSYYFLYL